MIGPLLLVGMTSAGVVVVPRKGSRTQRVPFSIATGPDLMQVKVPAMSFLSASLVLEFVSSADLNIISPLKTPWLPLTIVSQADMGLRVPATGRLVYAMSQRSTVRWRWSRAFFTEEDREAMMTELKREMEDLLLLGVVDKTW